MIGVGVGVGVDVATGVLVVVGVAVSRGVEVTDGVGVSVAVLVTVGVGMVVGVGVGNMLGNEDARTGVHHPMAMPITKGTTTSMKRLTPSCQDELNIG